MSFPSNAASECFFSSKIKFLEESSVNLSKATLDVLLSLDPASSGLTESGWPGAILYSWQTRLCNLIPLYDMLQHVTVSRRQYSYFDLIKLFVVSLSVCIIVLGGFCVGWLWERNVLTAFKRKLRRSHKMKV